MAGWDPVPWAVDGASHSVNVGRLLAYNAANANEGIVRAPDCAVAELDTPADQVKIMPGAVNILNRTPGYRQEMYMGRLPKAEQVDIGSTGSGGGRSDLVIVRVEDPNLSGSEWDEPDESESESESEGAPSEGPYIHTRVIADVPSDTESLSDLGEGWSGLALARIDIPKNTGTIEQDMIEDLRLIANRRQRTEPPMFYALNSKEDGKEYLTAKGDHGEYWPDNGRWKINIPEWATQAYIRAEWNGVGEPPDGNAYGRLWVQIGDNDIDYIKTQTTRYNTSRTSTTERNFYTIVDHKHLPKRLRGTKVQFGLRGRIDNDPPKDEMIAVDYLSSISLEVTFTQVAELDRDHEGGGV